MLEKKDFYDAILSEFETAKDISCIETKQEYLSSHFFDFDTYDAEIDELFCARAIEVCKAITNKKTFDYIANDENYKWYLIMVNMPFFRDKISWGTSVRGAFWENEIDISRMTILDNTDLGKKAGAVLKEKEWLLFLGAIYDFIAP